MYQVWKNAELYEKGLSKGEMYLLSIGLEDMIYYK